MVTSAWPKRREVQLRGLCDNSTCKNLGPGFVFSNSQLGPDGIWSCQNWCSVFLHYLLPCPAQAVSHTRDIQRKHKPFPADLNTHAESLKYFEQILPLILRNKVDSALILPLATHALSSRSCCEVFSWRISGWGYRGMLVHQNSML